MDAGLFDHLERFPLIARGQVGRNLIRQLLRAFADDAVPGQPQNLLSKDLVASLVNALCILEIDGVGHGVDQGVHQLKVAAQFLLDLLPFGLVLCVVLFLRMEILMGIQQGLLQLANTMCLASVVIRPQGPQAGHHK